MNWAAFKSRLRRPTGAEWLRLLVTLLVFAILGPAIGGGLMIAVVAALLWGTGLGVVQGGYFAIVADLGANGWFLAYVLGLVPAILTGVAVSIRNLWFGGAGAGFVTTAGIAIGGLWAIFGTGISGPMAWSLIVLASLVASLVCWRLSGGRWKTAPAA